VSTDVVLSTSEMILVGIQSHLGLFVSPSISHSTCSVLRSVNLRIVIFFNLLSSFIFERGNKIQ
jgi:hypothetical protein